MTRKYDAIVVGSGPNGLAAAITIAQRGGSVLLLEAAQKIGGGTRSEELTLPGYLHDVCSAVHPLGVCSPFFASLPLEKFGLKWIYSPSEFAHPLDDGTAVLFERSIEATAQGLNEDSQAYMELFEPFVKNADALIHEILQPMVHIPRHPFLLSRFGLSAILPAQTLAYRKFRGIRARALFAGAAAHSTIPLSWPGSSASALMLMVAGHFRGWPIPQRGAQKLADSLVSYFKSLGGEIQTGMKVESLDQLPESKWVLLDVTPSQFVQIGSKKLSETQKRRLTQFRYGIGVFKMDFALSGPIPWMAPECGRAATVHLGGSLEDIEISELAAQTGRISPRPFVLLAQPSLFDSTRAPTGHHTVWAYCHVPNGAIEDRSDAIENQIERFAPGFRSRILGKSSLSPIDLQNYNPNYIGGDISGGAMNLKQLLFRPRLSLSPYSTPIPGVFLCSSSTPPGPGVHGMCGYWAAQAALQGGTTI